MIESMNTTHHMETTMIHAAAAILQDRFPMRTVEVMDDTLILLSLPGSTNKSVFAPTNEDGEACSWEEWVALNECPEPGDDFDPIDPTGEFTRGGYP
jgi:hypothetical protein